MAPDAGTVIGLAGFGAGLVALWLARAPQRIAASEESQDLFVRTRSVLQSDRATLTARALEEQRRLQPDVEVPLLMKSEWMLSRPVPLHEVLLRLRDPTDSESLIPAREQLQGFWPGAAATQRFPTYSAAVGALAKPAVWFNGRSYRLLEASFDGGVSLTFGLARYFDGLDTTEALAFETALQVLRRRKKSCGGSYRAWLADPFDPSRRAAILGVNVLTIRKARDQIGFFLHQRDGNRVASAMNVTHVIPAGEFQPQADSRPVWRSDLDLWRTAMREYAEEYIGTPDASGDTGVEIDYANDEPYSQFEAARASGHVKLWFLGLGMDPLSWKPEACVAAVWDGDAFDQAFQGMLNENSEGRILVGRRLEGGRYAGLDFTEENVLGYAHEKEVLPAGRACLSLAWRWRAELGVDR